MPRKGQGGGRTAEEGELGKQGYTQGGRQLGKEGAHRETRERRGAVTCLEGTSSGARAGGRGLLEPARLGKGWGLGTSFQGLVAGKQEGGVEAAGESRKVRQGQKDPVWAPT